MIPALLQRDEARHHQFFEQKRASGQPQVP